MNRNDLEKIVAIAEEGSMAKAAQRLYITQPALSKCLNRVEEELGEVLFLRRPNGLTPTYTGECLIQKAHQIMHLYDALEMDFCDLNEMRKGTLKIGTARRLSALVLPEALYRFQNTYPNIRISIIEDNSFVLENKVMQGELDIAIICLPTNNPNTNYDVFYRDPCLIAVPAGHPANQFGYTVEGETLPFMPVEALRNQKLVLTNTRKKSRAVADRALAVLNGEYEINLESNNIEAVIRFVARGLGLSIIPSVFAQNYLEPDRIQYYRMEEASEVYHEWAVLYGDSPDHLPRPSRELYRILCKEKSIFPEFLG